MCGILGVFRKNRSVDDGLVRRALDLLSHRGPDDEGTVRWSVAGNEIVVGHRRLSIIDLTPGGHQPMQSSDGVLTLTFNGEIYNYKELRRDLERDGRTFHSSSDSEVLIEAWAHWGPTCLHRLEGMFAFAILNRREQSLTCVRDAFGIKPLLYATDDDGFSFASEPAALWALRGRRPSLDWQRCYDYLVHGDYDSTERTFVEGVRHLLPAHMIRVDLATGRVSDPTRWWSPPIERGPEIRFVDAVEQVREQFLRNVKLHLRSDVPLGAALSGGIDSSALVCGMRHVEPEMPIHTFSYVVPGSSESEERWADSVNLAVGAIAHKVTATAEDLARDIDDMIRAQGEPFGSTSIYAQYRVFQCARQADITVMLDGQGADELLAGYQGYPGQRLLSLLEAGRLDSAVSFANHWARLRRSSVVEPWLHLGREVLPGPAYRMGRALLGKTAMPAWLDLRKLDEAGVVLREQRPTRVPDGRGRRVIERMGHALSARELPALLRHADRNSMRFSIESRVPFLTLPLAESLLSLPEDFLISPEGETKRVLRAAMRGIVPDEILNRTDKIGFAAPDARLLLDDAPQTRGWLRSVEAVPFIRSDVLVATFDDMSEGRGRLDWRAWRWVNFARWVEYLADA